MKIVFSILIIFGILFSCGKDGLIAKRKKKNLYGIWQMTQYEVNNQNVINSTTFNRNEIRFFTGQFSGSTEILFQIPKSNCVDSIHNYSANYDVAGNKLRFDDRAYCPNVANNILDPIFYEHGGSIKNTWKIKSFSRKILVLTNELTERDQNIKIVFEKEKNIYYDR